MSLDVVVFHVDPCAQITNRKIHGHTGRVHVKVGAILPEQLAQTGLIHASNSIWVLQPNQVGVALDCKS